VLGTAALMLARDATGEQLRRYVATLALLSLVLATTLRAVQIHEYVDEHLAPHGRQIVFIEPVIAKYTQDLVQNNPFLRNDVWTMLGHGRPQSTAS
jgi:hypothetical protein